MGKPRSQRELAQALLRERGIVPLVELREAGVTAATMSRMERAVEVIRQSRGVYQLPDADLDPNHSMAEAAKRVPKGVVCLVSALTFHGLTDQLPPKVWMAIGPKDWAPQRDGTPIRIVRFTDSLLREDFETHAIDGPRQSLRSGQDGGGLLPASRQGRSVCHNRRASGGADAAQGNPRGNCSSRREWRGFDGDQAVPRGADRQCLERSGISAPPYARLQNLSRETGQSFELILTRYAVDRLPYRLSTSAYAERFVLKGAMLLASRFEDPHRAARDLDLLGFGDPDPDAMIAAFREILAADVADGVEFDSDALRVDQIREELEYGGLRLRTTASISGARIAVTVDVGFGDALEPGPEVIDYPSMLELPTPRLRAYARETVIAEKFQAMVVLGRANSRMKDFYDVWLLSQSFTFDDDRLARAIAATFARRGTEIPTDLPDALTPAFVADEQKQRQWHAFVDNVALEPGTLAEVIASIGEFMMRHAGLAVKVTA